MREIVFDTETTGVRPDLDDRVVEIGMVELIDLVPTGNTFHRYINPQRAMPADAYRVHGLSDQFLSQFRPFADPDIVDAMLAFIGDDPLVAHNAEFDRRFLNAELARLDLPLIPESRCIDTVMMARKKFPGAPASLDALCRRFAIDLSAREKHGALLDARLLAAVYLELKGGRERRLAFLDPATPEQEASALLETPVLTGGRRPRPVPLAPRISPEEQAAHAAFVAELGGGALWRKWA